MSIALRPTIRHIHKEGCCAVRGCWSTATVQRERYGGVVMVHYCSGHADTAARAFGAERGAA